MLGSSLSHYRIETVLGAGGMGTVYRARDTQLDRTVAIKILSGAATRDARQLLLREARAASALTHSGIVTIHSIEQQDGVNFIVMEHVEGRALSDVIPAGGLPIETASDYANQIAAALAAAHRAGVVHRDIKPANVMIAAGGQVKVLDFGVARRSTLDPDAATRAMTVDRTIAPSGVVVGTVGYLSPEQIAGQPTTPASDVFAFGVVLYQMLTGVQPFQGPTMWAMMDATVRLDPPALSALRADVPPDLGRIVERCLAKDHAGRFQSGDALLAALTAVRDGATRRVDRGGRRLGVAAIVAALVLASAGLGAILWTRAKERRATWARTVAAEIERRVDGADVIGAYRLARSALERAPTDPVLLQTWPSIGVPVGVTTTPVGADVAIRSYDASDEGWIPLGRTPLPADTIIPFAQVRWRITKDGYDPIEVSPSQPGYAFELVSAGTAPPGMVHVPAGSFELESTGHTVALPAYWIDRYEVTNRQFKAFVDAGGYRTRKYWPRRIVGKDGRELSWDAAMAQFRDATGRSGPSTWEVGSYPDGAADLPVSGVSWYEATAYAAFAGKALPTVYHWYRASGADGTFAEIVRYSNFAGKGPAPVGSDKGLGPYGTYDTAGNVKEWCWNEAADGKRFILGGAYGDATYQFRDEDGRQPIGRAAEFGFRCIRTDAPTAPSLLEPIVTLERDPASLKPVADAVFDAYKRLYDYDPVPLDARVEREDASSPHWTRQRVSFRAAYGNERVPADVFVPKSGRPPYQAVVYFPGSGATRLRSSRWMWLRWIEFLVRSGRIVVYPIYQQTYERRTMTGAAGPNAIREISIQRAQDLRRAVDYLQSRPDVDASRIAGYGLSLGAQLMPVFLVVEPRLRTGVLLSGGFETWEVPPEIDPVNFAPHVTQPVLMVNGRDDFDLPYASAQVPLFNMLGTGPADKRHVVLEGGHMPSKSELVVKAILDWLDKYLGPVQ